MDFANRTWKEPVRPGVQVVLKKGQASFGQGGTYTLTEGDTEYLDVNGDGHEDVILSLMAEEGNGYEDSRSVWLWDPETEQPRQVLPALSMDQRCGDITKSLRLTSPNRFTVSRLVRTDEACAVTPTRQETSTLRLQGQFAWQTTPSITALHCPYILGRGLNFPGSDFGEDGPRAWPDRAAPVIIRGKDMQAMDVDDGRDLVPSGWNRILYIQSDKDKGNVPPCGYFPAP